MLGSCALAALNPPTLAPKSDGSGSLFSSPTLPMKRHCADRMTWNGVSQLTRRLWRQRGLIVVLQFGPNRPAQSNVCCPGAGVVRFLSRYEPLNVVDRVPQPDGNA